MDIHKPTKVDLQNAYNKSVADVISKDLKVLFCGINPGLYTAAVQQHFGRPGNKFWKALHGSGFTPKLYHPSEQKKLLNLGIGITNLVNRATARADEVNDEEFIEGGELLVKKISLYTPCWTAFVGIQAFRIAFQLPKAIVGKQDLTLGKSKIWLLPSSSGLNAHYPQDKYTLEFVKLNKEIAHKGTDI